MQAELTHPTTVHPPLQEDSLLAFPLWYPRNLLHVIRPQFEGKNRQEAVTLLRSWTFARNVEAILEAAGPETMGLLILLDNSALLYDELASILRLPGDRVQQAVAEFVRRNQDPNLSIVSVERHLYPVARGRVRLNILQAAVAIAADGNWREVVRDPTRTGSYECRCFRGGFELNASSGFVDQPLISLVVGKKRRLLEPLRDLLKRFVGQTRA